MVGIIIAIAATLLGLFGGFIYAVTKDKIKLKREEKNKLRVQTKSTSWAQEFINLILSFFYKVERLKNDYDPYSGDLEMKDVQEYSELLDSSIMQQLSFEDEDV